MLSYSLLVRSSSLAPIRRCLEESPHFTTPPTPRLGNLPQSAAHRPPPTADRPTPSTLSPRPKPPVLPVGDSQFSTCRIHYSYEARAARKSKPPEKQLRASPARRLPAPATRPWRRATADRGLPTSPAPSAPSPRPRPQVARADPRSQLRTTPTNTGPPAAPRAHTPAPRLTPQPGAMPPPRRPNPSPR